jgi:uncharacterized membrane protein YdjX (TVP38/TMEM64 family)
MKKIIIPFSICAISVILVFLIFENMEQYFVDLLQMNTAQKNKYAMISFLVLCADIILPVPSSIVMYSNGLILGLIQGAILSMLSLNIGAILGYYLGKYSSMGLKANEDPKATQFLHKYGALALLLTRGIPILSESIAIICGYHKMAFKQYMIYNIIGYLPLCLLYAYFGSVGYNKNNFLLSFVCAVLISACFWLIGKSSLLSPKQSNSI